MLIFQQRGRVFHPEQRPNKSTTLTNIFIYNFFVQFGDHGFIFL